MDTFGQRLSALRKSKSMTQKQLAAAVDMHVTYIQKIENGAVDKRTGKQVLDSLTWRNVQALADAVESTVGYLNGDCIGVPDRLIGMINQLGPERYEDIERIVASMIDPPDLDSLLVSDLMMGSPAQRGMSALPSFQRLDNELVDSSVLDHNAVNTGS